MSQKLDIFETLKEVDNRNIHFFDALDADQKKSFAPVVFMRWLSSSSSQLELVNAVLNPMVFRMHKHPALMYKLMTVCSDGKSKRYGWVKKKGKDKSAPKTTAAISQYYDCSKKDASRYKTRLTVDDVLEMAEELGYTSDDIKKIKAEWK